MSEQTIQQADPSDDELLAAAQAPAAPPHVENEPSDDDLTGAAEAVDENRRGQSLAQLDTIFKASTFKEGDQHARVLELSRVTGAPTSLVEANMDGFARGAELADWNPERFYDENPILAQILLERPEAAPVILKKQELNLIQRLGSYMREGFADFNARTLSFWSEHSSMAEEKRQALAEIGGQQTQAAQKQQQRQTEGDTSILSVKDADLTGFERIFGRGPGYSLFSPASPEERAKAAEDGTATPPPWLAVFGDAMRKDVELASLGSALIAMKYAPRGFSAGPDAVNPVQPPQRDTYDVEKRILDLQNERVPTTYGEGPVESAVLEAVRFIPWMASTAITTTAGTLAGGPGVGAAAGFATNFALLQGGTYLSLREEPLDNGKKMEDGTAIAASSIYALLQAGIQTQAFHQVMQAWGPLGEMVRRGEAKAFTEALLRDATLGNIIKDTGKRWIGGANAMAREMALQSMLSETTGYLARNASAHGGGGPWMSPDNSGGAWEIPEVVAGVEHAAQAAWNAYKGSLAIGVPQLAANVGAQVSMAGDALRADAGDRASSKIRAIIDYAKSGKAVSAVPDLISRLIKEESSRSGVPIDRLWMDARALPMLFQADPRGGSGNDWEPTARALGGDKLVTDIKAALVSGDKVPVQLEDFLSKWATKPVLMQGIENDLTTQPYYQTARERVETAAQRQREVVQLADNLFTAKTPPESEPEARLVEAVRESALKAGLGEQEIEKNVAIYRAFVRTQAAEFNRGKPKDQQISADSLFEQAEVLVRRGNTDELEPAARVAERRAEPPPTAPEPGTTEALQAKLRANDPNAVTQELPKLTPEQLARPAPPATPAPEDPLFKRAAAMRAAVDAVAAKGPTPSEWPMARGEGRALVTEDPSKPGKWRVTFVDGKGEPTGHIEAATHADALLEAHRAGADVGEARSSNPAPAPRASPASDARQGSVITPQMPNGEPVRYDVVEADTLIPSHTHNFSPHPDFPAGVQERHYQGTTEEQFKVISGAQHFNPAFLLTDTPSPLDGPPLVTEGAKRLVLGGNGRTMMIQRAFEDPAKATAYKDALLKKAQQFGLDPAQIEGMKAPVLVRTVGLSSESPKDQLVAGVRRYNEGMTQKLSEKARALAEAKTMSYQTIQDLAGLFAADDKATLRDFMRDHPNDVLAILRRDGIITPQNQTEWLAGGELTAAAKDRLEGLFLGRVVETEGRLDATAPSLTAKIERIAPSLLRVAGVNPQFDQTGRVRGALDILNEIRNRGIKFDDLLNQPPLFDSHLDLSPETVAMARMLEALGPKAVQERFKRWAEYAAPDPQRDLFAALQPPPTDAGQRALLLNNKARDGSTLFQRDIPRNLIVQHNLSAENLLHADRLGGLAMPSIAVGRVEHPLQEFGEITLLAPSHVIDPKRGVPVFDADVYSPRHPTPTYRIDNKLLGALEMELKPFTEQVDRGQDGFGFRLALSGQGSISEPALRWPMAMAFFKEKAIELKPRRQLSPDKDTQRVADARSLRDEIDNKLAMDDKLRAEFETWAKAKLEPIIGEPVIEKMTITDNGRRYRRIPYTLENIVKEMKKAGLRGGEGITSLGSARAQGAKRFRSIGGIQGERDKIIPTEQFAKVKEKLDSRFFNLVSEIGWEIEKDNLEAGKITQEQFDKKVNDGMTSMDLLDRVATAIGDFYKEGSASYALRANGLGDGIFSGRTETEFRQLAHDLVDSPTEYFEAKPQKPVALSSFVAAAVPEGTKPEVLDALKRHGIQVYEYVNKGGGNGGGRLREDVIAKAAAEHDILFQRDAPGVPGLEDAAPLLQAAWHGSPHRFDKFELHNLGGGEGAQAFGWGLYFAKNPGVAEFYRNKLADSRVLVNGEEYHRPEGAGWAQLSPRDRVLERMRGVAEALLALQGKADPAEVKAAVLRDLNARLDAEYAMGRASESAIVPQLHSQVEEANSIDPKTLQFDRSGATYKVDLPESDRLLDYDKPLDQQPQRVQDAIRAAGLWPEIRAEKYTEPEVKTNLGITLRPIERYRGVVSIAGHDIRINEGSRTEKDALAGAIPTGGQFYDALSRRTIETAKLPAWMQGKTMSDPEVASKLLGEVGIPGMQYLDNFSRSSLLDEKSHNFVIWDDNEVRVLDRYFQQGQQAAIRGWTQRLREGTKRIFKVVLSEHANLSTLVHESGHVFLELMGDLAERPDAPDRLKEDWKATLAWLGVDERGQIDVKHHEKWARSFEQYLKEGKAPSSTLVRVFQRFRLWMQSIYTAAKAVPGSDLDPEISGIFDRLLATDQEIQNQARAAGFDAPLFSTPQQAGMSPQEFKDYLDSQKRALSHAAEVANVRTLKDQKRETDAAWREEASKIQLEVEKEFDARPDVRAYKLLRFGDPGDEPALAAIMGGDKKINRLSLMRDLKDVPPEVRDQILAKLIGRVANEGEVIPADIARVLGYASTEEMMRAVLAAPRKVDFVKEQVAQRMTEKHGDIVREREKLAELVGKALHEKPTIDWLMREYQALRKKAAPNAPDTDPPPLIESLDAAAAVLVGRMGIWDLSAPRILGLERKAGEDAFKALAKGEFKRALVAKQQQLLNALTHRYVVDAVKERDSFHDLLARVTENKTRGAIGKAGPEYLAGIDRLTEAMGVKGAPTPAEDAARPTFDQVLDRMVADGFPAAFDVEVVRQALADGPDPKVPLTVDTMREVDAAIRQIRTLATGTLFVMKLDQRVALEELLADIGSEAAAGNAEKPAPPASNTAAPWWWATYEKTQAINAALTDPLYMFERLGPTARDFFWGGWTASRDAEAAIQKRVTAEILNLWDHVPKQDRARQRDLLPEDVLPLPKDVNRDVHYRDRNWLLMVALNMGNASNKERLLGGYGWKEKQVVDALQKHLTHGEMEFVQKVWNLLNKELYPALAKHYESVNGIPPKKIEATPLTLTIDGVTKTYEGGYFPAKYDPVSGRSTVGVTQEEAAVAQLYGGQSAAASVVKGFTKERAKRFSDVVNLQWSVLPAHILDVVHYTAVDGFVRQAFKVMQQRSYRDAVQKYLGAKYETQIDQWLKVVASARAEEAPKAMEGGLALTSPLRSRYMMAVVGANLSTMASHLTLPLEAITTREVKARFGTVSMLQAMTIAGWVAQRQQALAKSPQLRDMAEQARHRLDVALAAAGGRDTAYTKARRFVDEAAHWGFDVVLKLTSTVIWDGRYRQEMAEHGDEARAVQGADSAIQHLYPSNRLAEQPAILRDKRGVGSLLAFYSYFSKLYTQVGRRMWHADVTAFQQADGALAKSKTLPSMGMTAGHALATMLSYGALAELFAGRGPEEDEQIPDWLLRKAVGSVFLLLPFGGDFAGAVEYAIAPEGTMRKPSERSSPAVAAFEHMRDALLRAFDSNADDLDRYLAAGELLAFGGRLPVVQPKRSLKYVLEPQDTSLPGRVSGVVYGERDGQPANPVTLHRRF